MPVPVFTSDPPVPPDTPPLDRAADLGRQVVAADSQRLDPEEVVAAPSIEPAVVPPLVSAEMSTAPPALVMNRASPPVLLPWKLVVPVPVVVIVALPAVLAPPNTKLKRLVMVALAAVLASPNPALPLFVITALPAVLKLENQGGSGC